MATNVPTFVDLSLFAAVVVAVVVIIVFFSFPNLNNLFIQMTDFSTFAFILFFLRISFFHSFLCFFCRISLAIIFESFVCARFPDFFRL